MDFKNTMQIRNRFIPNYNVAFGTNRRSYCVGPSNDKIYTQTEVNRPDLDFREFARTILSEFKDYTDAQIYVMACSDGSEPYTLAMHLNELDSVAAKKLLPIKATDRDEIILRYAQSHKLNMTQDDLKRLQASGIDYNKYFKLFTPYTVYIQRDRLERMTKTYDVSDFLKQSVEFSQKTILQQVEEMDFNKPKIICCRNVLPYVGGEDEIFGHLYKIFKKMRKGDLLAIGDFDRDLKLVRELKFIGMEEIQHNVFKKIK